MCVNGLVAHNVYLLLGYQLLVVVVWNRMEHVNKLRMFLYNLRYCICKQCVKPTLKVVPNCRLVFWYWWKLKSSFHSTWRSKRFAKFTVAWFNRVLGIGVYQTLWDLKPWPVIEVTVVKDMTWMPLHNGLLYTPVCVGWSSKLWYVLVVSSCYTTNYQRQKYRVKLIELWKWASTISVQISDIWQI